MHCTPNEYNSGSRKSKQHNQWNKHYYSFVPAQVKNKHDGINSLAFGLVLLFNLDNIKETALEFDTACFDLKFKKKS